MKIYYHLAKINNWEGITKSFFNCILKSEIYKDCNEIKIGCVSDQDFSSEYIDYLKSMPKVNFYELGKLKNYEMPTLKMLYEDCLASEKNFKLLYFHTKGVSLNLKRWKKDEHYFKNNYPKRNYKSFSEVKKSYRYTRYWAKHFLIKNYKTCINYLNKNDIVCLKKDDEKFIPVNFWWTNSHYIKKIEKPEIKKNRLEIPWEVRFDSEMWICSTNEVKIKSFLKRNDEYKKMFFL